MLNDNISVRCSNCGLASRRPVGFVRVRQTFVCGGCKEMIPLDARSILDDAAIGAADGDRWPVERRKKALWSILNDPNLPDITITAQDLLRLASLVDDFFAPRDRAAAFLAHELDRATVVSLSDLPDGVVTMRSLIRYRQDDSGKICRATLVYPVEADTSNDRISVLTPVGAALVGLSEGRLMPYEASDGTIESVTVLEVLFQPEARGMSWL
jgi:regulator of nucleoside diphosphate kinase